MFHTICVLEIDLLAFIKKFNIIFYCFTGDKMQIMQKVIMNTTFSQLTL